MTGKVTDLESAIIWTNQFGTQSIGPVDQRRAIASITKVFTVILPAKLHAYNRLDMPTPVAQYLPDSLTLPANFAFGLDSNYVSEQYVPLGSEL